jgi:hypothetical protein
MDGLGSSIIMGVESNKALNMSGYDIGQEEMAGRSIT